MSGVRLLTRGDLERVLDFKAAIGALEAAFHAEREGLWNTPARIAAHTRSGGLLAMPSGGGSPEALGAKLVTTFYGNTVRGLPSVAGLYVLFDPETGAPRAVMDGACLTLIRTAAVSAVAANALSAPEARTLGVFGAGAQAEVHVRALATVRTLDRVVIWARRVEQALSLIERLRGRADLRVREFHVAEGPEAAAECDLVVTATAATAPVLQGEWLRDGAYVNPIGAHTRSTREIDTRAVARAHRLAIESKDALAEAGDFQIAEQEAGGVLTRVRTLGEWLDPAKSAERRSGGIAIFKSCGVAFEDLAVARLAFDRAVAAGLGASFDFDRG